VLYAGKNKGTFTGIDAMATETELADAVASMCDSIERLDRRVDAYCARQADRK